MEQSSGGSNPPFRTIDKHPSGQDLARYFATDSPQQSNCPKRPLFDSRSTFFPTTGSHTIASASTSYLATIGSDAAAGRRGWQLAPVKLNPENTGHATVMSAAVLRMTRLSDGCFFSTTVIGKHPSRYLNHRLGMVRSGCWWVGFSTLGRTLEREAIGFAIPVLDAAIRQEARSFELVDHHVGRHAVAATIRRDILHSEEC